MIDDDTPVLPAETVAAMIDHMNADHADAVLGYVHRFAGLAAAEAATLVSLDPTGMVVHATLDGTQRIVSIPFDHVLRDADDARDTLIAMARTDTH
jgi:putative heme iron utilization protein